MTCTTQGAPVGDRNIPEVYKHKAIVHRIWPTCSIDPVTKQNASHSSCQANVCPAFEMQCRWRGQHHPPWLSCFAHN